MHTALLLDHYGLFRDLSRSEVVRGAGAYVMTVEVRRAHDTSHDQTAAISSQPAAMVGAMSGHDRWHSRVDHERGLRASSWSLCVSTCMYVQCRD